MLLAVAVMVLVVGCAGNSPTESEPMEYEPELEVENELDPEEGLGDIEIGFGMGMDMNAGDFTAGLTENEYPGLEITATVLERMAILPGSVIRVNIVIENTGDQTVTFTQGSGTNTIPEALLVTADGLQPILPEDRLGISTMDFNVLQLLPGESVQFDWFVLAAEPNADFDNATRELFMQDELYVADLSWEELQEKVSDLTAAAPGSYDIHVYFRYLVGDEEADIFGGDTGFTQTTFSVTID